MIELGIFISRHSRAIELRLDRLRQLELQCLARLMIATFIYLFAPRIGVSQKWVFWGWGVFCSEYSPCAWFDQIDFLDFMTFSLSNSSSLFTQYLPFNFFNQEMNSHEAVESIYCMPTLELAEQETATALRAFLLSGREHDVEERLSSLLTDSIWWEVEVLFNSVLWKRNRYNLFRIALSRWKSLRSRFFYFSDGLLHLCYRSLL